MLPAPHQFAFAICFLLLLAFAIAARCRHPEAPRPWPARTIVAGGIARRLALFVAVFAALVFLVRLAAGIARPIHVAFLLGGTLAGTVVFAAILVRTAIAAFGAPSGGSEAAPE